MFSIRKIIRRAERFLIYRVLHADDTPHRLALGIAIGLFIAWTPTIGFQMALVILLASALKANRLVGVPIVWISNPFTLVPVYYPNYVIGRFIMGLFGSRPELTVQQIKGLLSGLFNTELLRDHLSDPELGSKIWQFCIELFNLSVDLWVGSFIVGLFMGTLGYIVSYKFIVWYRLKNPIRRLRRILPHARGATSSHDQTE